MIALTGAGYRYAQSLGSIGTRVRSSWRDFLSTLGLRLPRLRRSKAGTAHGHRVLDLDRLEHSARSGRRE